MSYTSIIYDTILIINVLTKLWTQNCILKIEFISPRRANNLGCVKILTTIRSEPFQSTRRREIHRSQTSFSDHLQHLRGGDLCESAPKSPRRENGPQEACSGRDTPFLPERRAINSAHLLLSCNRLLMTEQIFSRSAELARSEDPRLHPLYLPRPRSGGGGGGRLLPSAPG
jgi:hypothetical protein